VVVAVLLVIGLVGNEDEEPASERTPTQPRTETTERERPPPRPRRVVLRIAPVAETYVCVDTGPGTAIRFEGTLTEAQTFRGRRLRVNFGNTSVQVRKNGRPFPIEPSASPVGFAFTPRSSRPLPLGERPCA
jgi:hypothetical protein